MPELPEVETVRRGLEVRLVAKRIAGVAWRRRDLRLPLPAGLRGAVSGRVITAVGRRGKYLSLVLDDGACVLLHLGMSGRVALADQEPAGWGAHEHVRIEMEGGPLVRFIDPRRFGLVTLARADALARHPLLARLGPDPLANGFGGRLLEARLGGRRGPIKNVLMDQRVIAGIGNIYACESLFRARLSPRRGAATVRGVRAVRLARALREVLEEAVAAGGSSLRDHVQVSGEIGRFQHRFAVYGREGRPCPGCDCAGGVRRIVQAGRATFFCARRQR